MISPYFSAIGKTKESTILLSHACFKYFDWRASEDFRANRENFTPDRSVSIQSFSNLSTDRVFY